MNSPMNNIVQSAPTMGHLPSHTVIGSNGASCWASVIENLTRPVKPRLLSMYSKTCPSCGKDFKVKNKTQVTCSRECSNKHFGRNLPPKPAHVPATITCQLCKKEFTKATPNQRFCSYKCQKTVQSAKDRAVKRYKTVAEQREERAEQLRARA